ncbi:methyltransferase [Nakamurella sp. A5-74]|uniref:Methyltransferase n=1 Tax=Nakamurella sp. A5-74 TaxID=3158264 RepID=A0AAU8DR66_9ACTN
MTRHAGRASSQAHSAAFANIAAAMRPGTVLTQLVWQDSSRQEWHTAIRHALTGEPNAPSKPFAGSAFSMADPAEVNALLSGAGFIDVRLTEVREGVCYGPDVATALQALRSLGMTDRMLRDQDDSSADRALDRLRSLLDARDLNGVWFDSSAWLVTARRRS